MLIRQQRENLKNRSEKNIEQDNPMHTPKTILLTIVLAPVYIITVTDERTKSFWGGSLEPDDYSACNCVYDCQPLWVEI